MVMYLCKSFSFAECFSVVDSKFDRIVDFLYVKSEYYRLKET